MMRKIRDSSLYVFEWDLMGALGLGRGEVSSVLS